MCYYRNLLFLQRKNKYRIFLKKVKYHPYRVRLIHELAEDDFDRRTEFCEYMMDHNNQNNGFIANILFSTGNFF
ncbi:hypothetical protein NQ318_022007 [Aromia moschata]|uniref:Uncharacterized protein n=1 Tax=Aromia moschata TaxID=1265417 RepID=A0AAV8Z5H5_9CUCU|nr:hypothetical protein NQ318_022007 [Aromia moschata]